MEISKLYQLKKNKELKKILECIFYIKMKKKVCHKIQGTLQGFFLLIN